MTERKKGGVNVDRKTVLQTAPALLAWHLEGSLGGERFRKVLCETLGIVNRDHPNYRGRGGRLPGQEAWLGMFRVTKPED